MECPDDLSYTEEHEWIRVESSGKEVIVVVGITDYAQESLGDIVHVELPSEGDEIQSQEPFGSVESVKAVSDLFAPVSGKVLEVNDALLDSPEIVNEDPYGEAWMLRVSVSNPSDMKKLMNAEAYRKFVDSSENDSAE